MRTYGPARKAIYNHDFSKAYVATLSARELVNLEAEARERQRFDVLAWVAASLRKASPRAEVVAAELAQEVAQLGQGVEFVEDGYLDSKETTDLFTTIEKFNGKTSDIYDVLTINEQKNEKYIEQVSSLVDKTKEHFKKILTVAIEGCEKKSKHYKNRSESVVGISLKKYTVLHFFWMGKYAKGGEKKLGKAVFANLIDIITAFFILSRPVLILTALFTYPNIKKKNKEMQQALSELAELELKRVEEFRKIIQKN